MACLSGNFRRVTYDAGLRGGEVTMLRVGDFDSKRMLIRRAGRIEPP
jgi:integrase